MPPLCFFTSFHHLFSSPLFVTIFRHHFSSPLFITSLLNVKLRKERIMTVQIFDPTTEVTGRRIAYVPRPKSLDGLRIGLVDNTKHNSDQLLLRIAALLEREHGAKAHVIRRKHSA